ncbi:MAG: c-type cytochrome [Xanthomonadales bacterium]|jgi:cytochrome c5|nr:c-type cytochrome [Xanthomonadales bacterium]
MLRILLVPFLIPVILLVACAQESDAPAVTAKPAEKTAHAESWRDDQLLEGQETYQAACASCHDSGEGGAPVTGEAADWSKRSDLWVAVLSDHAAKGYLDMPGKGGRADLSKESVDAALEYMLQKTFPELPRD